MGKTFFLAILLFAAAGCETSSKVTSTVLKAKGDCPDCDPHGGHAMLQAGISDRFYKAGDQFLVAFRFNHRGDMNMEAPDLYPDRKTASEIFLFQYAVKSVTKDIFENVMREVVEIEVTQAVPSGENAELFSPVRLDQHEYKLTFTMNDLLDPLTETFYNTEYPNGNTVEVTQKSSLNTGSSLYPHTVPRALINGAKNAPPPPLPPDLEDIASYFVPDYKDRVYFKFDFDNGDLVYWAKGSLWPFYVATAQGEGILVKETLVP